MDTSINNSAELASVRADLAALRSDLGALIGHFEKGAVDGAREAAHQFKGGVRDLSKGVADGGQQSARAVGVWIEEQPLLAFLIAIGVGYVGARALLR